MEKPNKSKIPPKFMEIPYAREFIENVLSLTDFDYSDEVVVDFGLELSRAYGHKIGSSNQHKIMFHEIGIKSNEILNNKYSENNAVLHF
jgi:hypothetical protein